MSFRNVCLALQHGGAELILSNPLEALFVTRRLDGDVYWRVTEPGRIDVASAPEGPWTAATYGITIQLNSVGQALTHRERMNAMEQLDLALLQARDRAGIASGPNAERARNPVKSGAGQSQSAVVVPPYLVRDPRAYAALCADLAMFRDDFPAWIDENWHIWRGFCREADRIWAAGREHYSARTIVEVLRHESRLRENGGDGWKINDHHTPDLARLYVAVTGRAALFEFRNRPGPTTIGPVAAPCSAP